MACGLPSSSAALHIVTLSNSGSKDLLEYKHFQLTAADYLI